MNAAKTSGPLPGLVRWSMVGLIGMRSLYGVTLSAHEPSGERENYSIVASCQVP